MEIIGKVTKSVSIHVISVKLSAKSILLVLLGNSSTKPWVRTVKVMQVLLPKYAVRRFKMSASKA
jgi:hypothetical protein